MFKSLSNTWRKHWKDITAVVVIIGSLATICGILVIDTNKTDPTQQVVQPIAAVSPAKSAAAKPAATPSVTVKGDTITYVATGSPATITYGVDDKAGQVPMKTTEPFNTKVDDKYTIIAMQTDEGETGKTVIKVYLDGKLMAKASATTEHKTASITVYKEFGTGKWVAAKGTS